MQNKKVLLLTALLALTGLAGCNQKAKDNIPGEMYFPEASQNEEEFVPATEYPEELLLNHRTVSILVNEDYQLRAIEQFNYKDGNLNFKSNNEAIATVDANGVIHGVAAGDTEIIASDKNNPDFKKSIPVTVNTPINFTAESDRIATIASDLAALDATAPTKFIDYEMYEKVIYKKHGNDENAKYEMISYDRFNQRTSISKEDAYFAIWETDAEIKTKDGSMDFTNFEWVFYTNPFFDTYTFHTTGDVKNYYVTPTQSYMEGERTAPMFDILDNIFTSGSEVFTNALGNVTFSKFTDMMTKDYTNVKDKFAGSNKNGDLLFGCTVTFDDDTASQDDEKRYGIPFGTPTPAAQASRYVVKDNKIVALAFEIEETYDIGDDHYKVLYHIDHKFDELTEIRVPNVKDYTLVERLFAV